MAGSSVGTSVAPAGAVFAFLRLDADGGEPCIGGDQRDAVAVAGLAPDGLALAHVNINLFEEALGEHRADHLGGGASADAVG